jgi:hypothetical protein
VNLQIEKDQVLTYGLPIIVILSSVFLALSPLMGNHPNLAIGITYDLTLTAPLIYFLLIRKKRVPLFTVVPFFILGITLASLLLPNHQQDHLDLIKTYLLPAIELIVFSVISYHVFKLTKAFKEASNTTYDFYTVLKESAIKTIGSPKIARIFASEIAMVYYALFSWKKAPALENGFTNYKENGITALLGVILFLLLIETSIAHLLLVRWNETLAWLIFISSLYAAVQIFGHLKALRQRTSEWAGNQLHLKYGLFGDIELDIRAISRIELTSNDVEDETRSVAKLALLKELESHNVVIYFTGKQKIEKAYGVMKECDTLLVHIDDRQAFKDTINNALQQDYTQP